MEGDFHLIFKIFSSLTKVEDTKLYLCSLINNLINFYETTKRTFIIYQQN